jgi:murein DD-endopeptidase MepM/ murein hydrolase activator NlpD
VAVVAVVVPTADVVALPCWRPPVVAPVADPFRAPACRWCPANRGIEFRTRPGQLVTAVATGRVTFAGRVAGVSYLGVEHADHLRVTYGRLAERTPDQGDVVVRGQRIGTTGDSFHFGVRRGQVYLDPTPLLGRLTGLPRLVPIDGSAPPPAPPARLRCSR